MATYYVSGSGIDGAGVSGNTSNPWRTLNYAKSRISPGDTVKIRNGTYREVLVVNKANTTWEKDTGHTPVIDGNYHEGLFSGGSLYAGNLPSVTASTSYLPGDVNSNILIVSASGVTIRGLRIQNVAGRAIGVGVGGSSALIEDNDIYFCAGGAIIVNPTGGAVSNVTISGNKMDLLSMKKYSPDTGAGQGGVQGGLKLGNTINSSIEFNIVRRCFGEGINLGKGNDNLTCSYNTIYDCAHVLIYNNRSDNTEIIGNICFHTGDTHVRGPDGTWSAGIIFGDEKSGSGFPKSSGGVVYNNIIVNCGKLFQIRNNFNSNPEAGYDTTANQMYVGFNTFVAGPCTDRGIHIDKNEYAQPHRNSVFENNIIDFQRAPSGTPIFQTNGVQGFAFRNNLWTTQPATDARSSSDRYGNPFLFNPGRVLRPSTTDDVADHNFSPLDYRLTTGSDLAVNNASNGSAFNGLTMPSVGGDYFGGSRPFGAAKDIGFHELGAAVGTITANFTQNGGTAAISVAVGATVTFADTTSGAPVSWDWNFDDGNTSDVQDPTHAYSQPGTYNVVLRVANASGVTSTKTGATITVTSTGGDATVIIDVKRKGAKTTTGNDDYTGSLGGASTKAALYFNSFAVTDGTAANGMMLSIGAAVASDQQWSQAFATQHGVSPSNVHRQHRTDSCLISIDAAGAITGKAVHGSHIANGHRMNVTDAFPSAFLTTAVLFAGDGVQAKALTVPMSVGASVPVTVEVGFPYSLVFMTTTGGDTNVIKDHGLLSFGIALADGTQYRRVWSMDNNANPTWARVSPSNAAAGQVRGGDVVTVGADKSTLVISPPTSTGFTITPDKEINAVVNLLVLRLEDVSHYLSDILTPLTTGAYHYSGPEFEPMFLMELLTLINDPDTDPSRFDPISGSFGFFVKAATGEYTTIASTKVNVATTDDQSLADDRLVVPAHDGSGPTIAASGIAFVSDGFTPTYTAVDTTLERRFVALAIGTGSGAPTGPVANFSMTPRSGEAPLATTGTSLSDPNGDSIDTYLWNMGDGTEYATQNVTHTYDTPGSYTVSLTVTNGNGTDVETKVGYITVTGAPGDTSRPLMPHEPLPVTNHTINQLHNETGPLRGYHEHSLDQDSLYIDANPEDPVFKQGKVRLDYMQDREGAKSLDSYENGVSRRTIPILDIDWMRWDGTNSRFLFKTKSGIVREIATAAVDVGGLEASRIETGEIVVTISDTLEDGIEKGGGVIDLSNNNSITLTGDRYAIFFFRDVTIPADATILAASLTLEVQNADKSTPAGMTIYADDDATPAVPSATDNDISDRTPTTATATWNGGPLGKGTQTSPDITAVIQELCDIGGRSETFDIAIIIEAATDTNFACRSRGWGESTAARLSLTYEPAP